MKILSIGNSFSEDAQHYLTQISNSAGIEIKAVNLFIGGCSFETHAKNIQENNAYYRYELNGSYTKRTVSVKEVLCEEKWDIITVQQYSGLSGVYESYIGYIDTVLDCIKQHCPGAKIYFHQTWAYEVDNVGEAFARYRRDQTIMHSAIVDTSAKICREYNLSLIPVGIVINTLRKTETFNYADGGISLCRDTSHLNLIYGRYAAALVWYRVLVSKDLNDAIFVPDFAELEKINLIKDTVKNIL